MEIKSVLNGMTGELKCQTKSDLYDLDIQISEISTQKVHQKKDTGTVYMCTPTCSPATTYNGCGGATSYAC